MKSKNIKVLLVILCIIITIGLSLFFTIHNKLSKVKAVKISVKPSELKIDTKKYNNEQINENFINILLLGEDSRDKTKDPGRSDSIIILTLDKVHKKIKMTSLMRDMIMDNMVGQGPMKGLNQDRLNHAYAYGGPELSIKVVNDNFNMNIKDFISVDFTHFDKIIDAVGGVDINISKEEIPFINSYVDEVAHIEKSSAKHINYAGLQHLNGIEALGYCRVRYVGNADFERTQRQRTVLTEVFKKITKLNLAEASSILDTMLSQVKTSLNEAELFSDLSYILLNKMNTVEQLRLPEDKPGYNYTEYVNKTYFLGWDKEKNISDLHEFIFEGEVK